MKKLTTTAMIVAFAVVMILAGNVAQAQTDIFSSTFAALDADPTGGKFQASGFACLTAIDYVAGSKADYGIMYALRICSGDTPAAYKKRACSEAKQGNRTALYMRTEDGNLLIADCGKKPKTLVFFKQIGDASNATLESMDGFMSDQALFAETSLANDERIIKGEKIIINKVDIVACQQRVDMYNTVAIKAAEQKYAGCVNQRSTILDAINVYRANQGDRWGEAPSRKDNAEDRLMGRVVEYSCKGKAKIQLANPGVCQVDPNFIPGVSTETTMEEN